MTLYANNTNPQDNPVKVATTKKKPAKKTGRAKTKRKVVKKIPRKPKSDISTIEQEDTLTPNQVEFCKAYISAETF